MIATETDTLTELLDATLGLLAIRPFAGGNSTKYRLICADEDCAEKLHASIIANMGAGDRDFRYLNVSFTIRDWLSMVCNETQEAMLDGKAINLTNSCRRLGTLHRLVDEQAVSAMVYAEIKDAECKANGNQEGCKFYHFRYNLAGSLWNYINKIYCEPYNEKIEKELRDNSYPTPEDTKTFPADTCRCDWKHEEKSYYNQVSAGIDELKCFYQSLVEKVIYPDLYWSHVPSNIVRCELNHPSEANAELLKDTFQSFFKSQLLGEEEESHFVDILRHNLVRVSTYTSKDRGALTLEFNNNFVAGEVASKLALWKLYTEKLQDVLGFISEHSKKE